MRPSDLTQETWRALTANKGRSALTMLGIVIGIGAVITMNSVIGGISKVQLEMFGANAARIVYITLRGIDNFTVEDLDELEANVAGYEYVMGKMEGNGTIAENRRNFKAKVIGSTHKFCEAHGYQFSQGAMFSEEEEKRGAQVVVLSQIGLKSLYGSEDASVVGKSININNTEYRIAGVVNKLDDYGSETYMTDTIYVLMPLTTAGLRVIGQQNITEAEGLVADADYVEGVKKETESYLKTSYRLEVVDDEMSTTEARTVNVYTNTEMLKQIDSSSKSFQMIAVTVSAVSLVVGGIGIMNMMLTNVTERIREIGLRKALGAKRMDIVSQFMLESICLCLIGGLIGIIMGIVGAYVLTGVVGQDLADKMSYGMGSAKVQPIIDVGSIVNSVLVCMVTGVLFGWYPAQRAARLDPVESLNHQ